MDPLFIFIYGFIGGCSPELVRIQRVIRDRGFIGIDYPYIYIIISICLALIGGLLAIAFGSPNMLNAFWIGASTPVIVSTFSKSPPV